MRSSAPSRLAVLGALNLRLMTSSAYALTQEPADRKEILASEYTFSQLHQGIWRWIESQWWTMRPATRFAVWAGLSHEIGAIVFVDDLFPAAAQGICVVAVAQMISVRLDSPPSTGLLSTSPPIRVCVGSVCVEGFPDKSLSPFRWGTRLIGDEVGYYRRGVDYFRSIWVSYSSPRYVSGIIVSVINHDPPSDLGPWVSVDCETRDRRTGKRVRLSDVTKIDRRHSMDIVKSAARQRFGTRRFWMEGEAFHYVMPNDDYQFLISGAGESFALCIYRKGLQFGGILSRLLYVFPIRDLDLR